MSPHPNLSSLDFTQQPSPDYLGPITDPVLGTNDQSLGSTRQPQQGDCLSRAKRTIWVQFYGSNELVDLTMGGECSEN